MMYADLAPFDGVRFDPLTNQQVSSRCWNGRHQDWRRGEGPHVKCVDAGCQCYCHPQLVEEEGGEGEVGVA
jgi:hypothetical protein